MYLAKVKEIAANILFLDSSDNIESDASFEEIGSAIVRPGRHAWKSNSSISRS